MFERYTEKARRTVFFARYEASSFGSPYIETEHLLLGMLREDRVLAHRLLLTQASAESIRKRVEELTPSRGGVSTSVDLPLSNESKRVLAYAAEEAERFSEQHISTAHLLLGLLREESCLAASLLNDLGLDLEKARAAVRPLCSTGAPSSKSVSDIVSLATGECSVEFVCGGDVLASASLFVIAIVPRIGEQVVIKNQAGTDVAYRVQNVTYIYDRKPSTTKNAQQLTQVVVEVRRTGSSTAGPENWSSST